MKVIFTGRGVEITDGIRNKVKEMLEKHESLLEKSTKIEVILKEGKSHSGVSDNLTVEITIYMPKALIRVEEMGDDFYVVVDKIDPVLRRRLVRYNDHKSHWEGKKSWKEIEREKMEAEFEDSGSDDYVGVSVKPQITRYKQFSKNSPMRVEEAIERMELLGHEAFLFKNIETEKYSMVYKKRDGTYGLVEPKDG